MAKIFNLPEFRDSRGKLTFVEEITHMPFEIKEVYILSNTDIPHCISLTAPAFIMAPKGEISINGKIISGINSGLLISSPANLPLTTTENTSILILSAEIIKGIESVDLPFKPRRAYFMAEVPQDKSRGSHAHFTTSQTIYALEGKFDVELDNGNSRNRLTLAPDTNPAEAPLGIWHTLDHFTPDAICMVLASERFNPDDYISEYPEFLELRKTLLL